MRCSCISQVLCIDLGLAIYVIVIWEQPKPHFHKLWQSTASVLNKKTIRVLLTDLIYIYFQILAKRQGTFLALIMLEILF